MTTRKPDNTKKWHTAQKGRSLCSKINNSNNKHTFLDFVMNWMIIAHPEAQKYQSLQTTEGRSRGEVLEDLTSNLREWMILMILILLPLISSRIQYEFITCPKRSDLIWLQSVFYLWAQSLFYNGGTLILNKLSGNLEIGKQYVFCGNYSANVLFK